jgi:hypothetical protein
MKNEFTKLEELDNIEPYLINIITINNSEEEEIIEEEMMDFDFDYDPNEMYYALLNED